MEYEAPDFEPTERDHKAFDERVKKRVACALVKSDIPEFSDLLRRITVDPKICSGKPNIRRILVAYILYQIAHGHSPQYLIDQHEGLETDDIRACMAYAGCFLTANDLS